MRELKFRLAAAAQNLTEALAHSNNAYSRRSAQAGLEKVQYYAHQFGLGELAGYRIPGEQLGTYPEVEIPAKLGGVSKMCSFGEDLDDSAAIGRAGDGDLERGTLFYLQHPASPEAVANFQPRVKRHLDIEPVIPELSGGMAGAVAYGTARSLRLNFNRIDPGQDRDCSHAARASMVRFVCQTDIDAL